MLRVLDQIEAAPEGLLSFEALHEALGYTRSTLYRHLKTLTDAGLVASLPDRGFTLGPRIMELDRSMRDRDPLIAAARPVMAELAGSIGGIALLCRRYRDRVLCIHQEQGDARFRSRYSRGLGRPMFRGAASRIILAHLPPPALARLHAEHAAEFEAGRLGATLAEVRETLRRMRAQGWDCSHGQVTPGVTGIAAPILERGDQVLGSLSITLGKPDLAPEEAARIAERVVFAAGVINRSLL
ncbi:IclR family transcriptional regulator [Roseomonas sp. OT10]|uniref:IclR family transcriptional regulator n=1 Tax=Roseomonas cutis TaxID=2897332 RepID=UPI001E3DE6AF|nr:IclR family transcriptional regulator [Roseomonas sp. OT10]UFN47883.1 IclR family transcriptional regulator [Roseomonas sp. OT10]